MPRPLYIEILIRGSLDELWAKTQDPALHERWDLRFSEIEYLPKADPEDAAQAQRFLYRTRIGFGMAIAGEGESVGERDLPGGARSSALRFWSDDPRSLIRQGSGYWKYQPVQTSAADPSASSIRFITGYDYQTRFGGLGRLVDRFVFRPMMGWATAWSFDRLRRWIEDGVDPGSSARLALVHALARLGAGLVWIYQGAVPKLIARHPDELAMVIDSGVSAELAPTVVLAAGVAEVAFGVIVLSSGARWPHVLTFLLMVLATLGVAVGSPDQFLAAFNPASLNLALAALAAVGWASAGRVPSARRCRRKKPKREESS